jgi:membrane protein implicated in regulation of membrane protease activity
MKKPSKYGLEGLIGAEVRVVSKLGPQDEAQYMVKVRGELWSANSRDDLNPGEVVKILSVNGLTLLVGKNSIEQSSPQTKKP